MSGWQSCKLGEKINLKRGYDLPSRTRHEGKYPIYSSSGISGMHNEKMCNPPGVVTGRYGTIGKVFYSLTEYWPLNTSLYVQDFKGNDEKFVYYFLKTLDWEKFSDKSAVPGINRNNVHEEDVSFPELIQQKSIAAVLSSLDDKVDLLHRQNKTLEAMAETIFRKWFVEEAESQSGKQFSIGEIIESVSTTHKFPSSQIVFLNTSDIYKGEILTHSLTDVGNLPGQAKKTIQKDDILFSEIRPANGRWAYISFEAENYVVSTKLMVLRSRGVISQALVYFYLTNKMTVDWLQILADSRSGTFPQITFDQLRGLTINIPPGDVFESVSDWCDKALIKIISNKSSIKTLEKLRDNLLPKLMSGGARLA